MRKALFLSILFFIFLNPFFSQEIVHTEDLIAVELEELEKEKGFTEDEDLEELVTEEPPASLEDKEEKIPHQSLPGIPDEILQRPDVEKFRQQYLSEKWSKLLYQYLEDAMEYRLYVRKAIQEKEMPAILEYLPVVESNYKTNAKSRSGAIGMWQFMANSVWPFLTLNDFVDERLDPWKSTEGALKKLNDNYNYFQDWLLAIAAYNCGVGAMTKCLKKAQEKNYWYLVDHNLLPSQTAHYVPKLLAIADLAMNSKYYGIELPDHEQEFKELINERDGNFDYLEVNKAYSITQLAQEMRIDEDSLKHLNPSFILGMTHPTKKSQIRLPLGMKEPAQEAIKKLTPIEFPFKYTVVAGDSLWSISRRYGVTVQAICDLNNIKENAILKIGKVLYIPKK
ncbi:MAG: transglycosylase SLT domain-containing protein [Treponema sp.]|nr:transglycosylase SLT domain-containing protein [Treponema sp.]MCI6891084.1 transglycosylase SLT domain-containing protein [Treponema sp.]